MNELETDNKILTFWAPNFSKQKNESILILDNKNFENLEFFFSFWVFEIYLTNCSDRYPIPRDESEGKRPRKWTN